MATINVGDRVTVVNFHGEPIPATARLGVGSVREVYIDCGEVKAEVWFFVPLVRGSWPVEMLRKVDRREPGRAR